MDDLVLSLDAESLEKMYRLFRWPEDISEESGRKRYHDSLKEFSTILSHNWMKDVLRRDNIRIVDVCSGTGIGGIALAKKIIELNKSIELTFVDLREEALKKAIEFSKAELGLEANVIAVDARELYKLKLEVDIAILWGLTTPHFNPIDLIKLYGSIGTILQKEGVLIVEEVDRFYSVCMLRGYKDFLLERHDKRGPVFSIHYKHDFLTGYTTRIILAGEETHLMDVYFWDIASSIAFAWMFFEDVDFVQGRPYMGYILAHRPRKKNNIMEIIAGTPSAYKIS
ncbi:MAG: class I SAM-dependent methyltransferase [Candidatus Methanodesulfokora washburnensis]